MAVLMPRRSAIVMGQRCLPARRSQPGATVWRVGDLISCEWRGNKLNGRDLQAANVCTSTVAGFDILHSLPP